MGKVSSYIFMILFFLILYTLFFNNFIFVKQKISSDKIPDFVFHDISIFHYTKGNLDLTVSANRATIDKDNADIIFEKSSGVSFFNDSFLRFNAHIGSLNLESGQMELNNTYLAYYDNDQVYWLNSDLVSWIASENQIISDAPVKIINDKFRIESDTMKWDFDEQTIQFSNYPRIYLNAYYEQ